MTSSTKVKQNEGGCVGPASPLSISSITPHSLTVEAEAILQSSRHLRDELVKRFTVETATFASFIRPLIDDENKTGERLTTLGWLLARVSPDVDLRAASRAVQAKLHAPENTHHHRQDIAAVVEAIYQRSHDDESLDAEDRYFLSAFRDKFVTSGAAVTDASQRERMVAIKSEIAEILVAAQKAQTEAVDGLALSEEELAGAPKHWLASLKETAEKKLWIPLTDDNFINIMQSASSEATRRAVYVADAKQMPENIERLSRLITLRHELALICGFKNHAELKMKERMEMNAQSVLQKLEELKLGAQPLAAQEVADLLMIKKSSADSECAVQDSTTLYAWDRLFYRRKEAQIKYSVDSDFISEFFEASHTLQQMLVVFAQLFGLDFKLMKDADIWHESVLPYSVYNSEELGGGFLGYLYLDIFERKGKYRAPHHMGFQGGFIDASGIKHYPASALICSFRSPAHEVPSLLQHRDVKILFHELGHGIHFMVEQTRYAIRHSRDYAEIPSRLLEHFIWVPEVLIKLGKHYTHVEEYKHMAKESDASRVPPSGEMPRELAESIARTQYQSAATGNLSMLAAGLFDLSLYTKDSLEETSAINTTALWNQIQADTVPYSRGAPSELGHGQTSSSFIFRNTDAAYYTYVLSTAYAADIFAERFAQDPMNLETALDWRRNVLEKGSGQSELGLLESFIGRPLSSKGFVTLLQQQPQQEQGA